MTRDILSKLRAIAFRKTDVHTLHSPAVDLLVEYGDAESVEPLTKVANDQGKLEQFSEPAQDPSGASKAQHNPQMLLDFIQSGQFVDFGVSRQWALNKAVELGVAKERMRSALISHNQNIHNNEFLKAEMADLKRSAIRLKVFNGDELPEVQLPSTQPGNSRPVLRS